jgi:hypothetical protein
MNRGLAEFDQEDRIFEGSFLHRLILTGVFTGTWYLFAKRINFFNSAQTLRSSLPVAAILSLYFSKGFVNHYIASKEVTRRVQVKRDNQLYEYKREIRSKNII